MAIFMNFVILPCTLAYIHSTTFKEYGLTFLVLVIQIAIFIAATIFNFFDIDYLIS